MIQIHNSLTGTKETFQPINPGEVRLYVCGMTVYDYCHLGHARAYIVFDVVRRHFEASGYRVEYVRNITDIDDKIIQRAQQNREPYEQLTRRFISAMHEDFEALGIEPPTHEPRATEFMEEIIAMVKTLVDTGHAYAADNGDVYYSVASFRRYGQLSGKRLSDLRSGARIEVDEAKRDPLDFVLWKAAKQGEPAWDSPWGPGRPGWHIECSAMSTTLLGEHFDIHGGGMDLKFPHHENEIAQSCAACGTPFVNLWMHNGFVRLDDEKMSKSLGNFFTVRDVMASVRDPEVIRYFMLNSHYRGPINYTPDNLAQADAALERLYIALRGVDANRKPTATEATDRFVAAMDDDFNTPMAIAELQSLARRINSAKADNDSVKATELAAELRSLGARLGLLRQDTEVFLRSRPTRSRPAGKADAGSAQETAAEPDSKGLKDDEIDRLIAERAAARKTKDFAESDRIRDLLAEGGVVLEDQPGGKTLWRRGR